MRKGGAEDHYFWLKHVGGSWLMVRKGARGLDWDPRDPEVDPEILAPNI